MWRAESGHACVAPGVELVYPVRICCCAFCCLQTTWCMHQAGLCSAPSPIRGRTRTWSAASRLLVQRCCSCYVLGVDSISPIIAALLGIFPHSHQPPWVCAGFVQALSRRGCCWAVLLIFGRCQCFRPGLDPSLDSVIVPTWAG